MKLRGIDFVVYGTKDLPRAIKYYEENLGLKVTETWEDKYVEFDVGNETFALMTETPGPSGTVAFNVPNMAEALKELEAKGVKPTWTHESPVCRMAGFVDLDGNAFMLHEKPKV